MLKRTLLLVVLAFAVPYLANDKPLLVSPSGNVVFRAPIPYGENQFFEGALPLPPSANHWLGTDDRGRDLLVRILYGFKNTFLLSLGVTLATLAIALLVGLLSVSLPAPFNKVILLTMETLGSLPYFFIILAVLSKFNGIESLVILSLLCAWIPTSFLVRGEALRVLSQNYILSARVLGASWMRLGIVHILPNLFSPIRSSFPLVLSGFFYLLAYLHYLGILSFEPHSSLGELLTEGRGNLQSPALIFAPLFATLLPIFLLFPKKGSGDEIKNLQRVLLKNSSHFENLEKFCRQKNRFARFKKLPE